MWAPGCTIGFCVSFYWQCWPWAQTENDHVRAIRVTLNADEAVPMRAGVDALAGDCRLRTVWRHPRRQELNTPPMEMLFIEVKAASKGR